MTIILKQQEIRKCVSISEESIDIIERGFSILSKGGAVMPPIMRLDVEDHNGEIDVKTAYIKGLDSFAIKISPGFLTIRKLDYQLLVECWYC